MNVLTINAGSSSLKMTLYRLCRAETRVLAAGVDRIGSLKSRIQISGENNESLFEEEGRIPDYGSAFRAVLSWIEQRPSLSNLDGIGHRVVLGDRRCSHPQLINAELVSILKDVEELAPDHLPQVIESIERVTRVYPSAPQVACFDSTFHRRMPRTSQMFGLPRSFLKKGSRAMDFMVSLANTSCRS
jgi:acetate kinase